MNVPNFSVGLIGAGIGESLSPALHLAEAERLGVNYDYQLFDLDHLASDTAETLRTARELGLQGVNVTHPGKQAVITELDELSEDARQIGAVNTVLFTEAGAVGHNTDAYGFGELARRSLSEEATRRVVQCGAGGAGAAVAHAQLSGGVEHLDIVDVDERRAHLLVQDLKHRFGADRVDVHPWGRAANLVAEADGFVNATPMGMAAHPGVPIDPSVITDRHWVIDIVYMPVETELMRAAQRRGARVTGGAGMTAFQAAAALELFTGVQPDRERMLVHVHELVAEKLRNQTS
ncbi:shikimate dehydrogenase (NADP(+)) [Leucobacter sp. Psy1]|uniref:shikimate dehydrogenase n=1 Tax=Leucobacter sp. Psy1 TaxID=2875729 RepID=UPI001CD4629A|nr:shikimate dehydrogenase [Leucobacter sp. Psy1]UBH07171.1 shikimate dehydrogenase (NADP(+)) [Leucobacter sp. Psy1]